MWKSDEWNYSVILDGGLPPESVILKWRNAVLVGPVERLAVPKKPLVAPLVISWSARVPRLLPLSTPRASLEQA